jgi:hypothetical protein
MTAAESREEEGQRGKGERPARYTWWAGGLLFSFSPFLLRFYESGVDGLKTLERGDD